MSDDFGWLKNLQDISRSGLTEHQLKTSIDSNIANTQLARETLTHFKDSKKDNRIALFSTLFISVVTCIILIVQTVSVQKTELTQPIELKSEELKQLLQQTTSNNLLLTQQLDSLRLELQKLTKTINSTYSKN